MQKYNNKKKKNKKLGKLYYIMMITIHTTQ